ncbi:hypothetical protein [Saccharospirillum impatiens]|uniref:hypothetical protein n=1 Tax=Saccharospirillum impatiens TaxID=169438 RepID=UPI000423E704|nr:hypothetical protein [Saccharospirillum impatiens]
MITPAFFVRPAPYRLALCTLLVALTVSGCQPDTASDTDDEVSDPVDTDDSGAVELALRVRTLNYTQSNPGPTQVVLDVQVPTEARIDLYMNDVLQKSWDTGEACVEFPAFILCEDDLEQSIATMIETGGTKRFELTALKGNTWKTVTFERDLTFGQCISNAEYYSEVAQPLLVDKCSSCHREGGDEKASAIFRAEDSWASFETTIFNLMHRLYLAPSHQEPGHNASPLEPYDADYRAIAELVWRTLEEFQCSPP